MNSPFDFKNKNVLVVGGTSGINRGIAETFAKAGARVAVVSRSQEKVDDTIQSLKNCGAADAKGFAADVRQPEAIKNGVAELHKALPSCKISHCSLDPPEVKLFSDS